MLNWRYIYWPLGFRGIVFTLSLDTVNVNNLKDTEKFPAPSAAQTQAHLNQFQLTSQHWDTMFSNTALYSKKIWPGCVDIRHPTTRARTGYTTADRTLKPHNIQYRLQWQWIHRRRTGICTYFSSVTMVCYPYSNWTLSIVCSKYDILRNRPLVCPQLNEEEGIGACLMSLDRHQVLVQVLLLGIRVLQLGPNKNLAPPPGLRFTAK
jgi:hypothetical protein